jgi:purine-binding chemotaxis protein CheW
MKTATRPQQFLDQQLALSAYIDALLEDVPVAATELEPLAAPEGPAALPTVDVEAKDATAGGDAVVLSRQGLPDWAESRFQALLFEVAGLTLAVPLVKLKGVVPSTDDLTPMPGHSPLFLGVVPYQGLQSKVVDTARFVLPADRVARLGDAGVDRCQHLVMIDEGRWALACTRIGDVVDLEPADIKWRSASGKRQWLAGTVIKRMCALLDIDQLTRALITGMG